MFQRREPWSTQTAYDQEVVGSNPDTVYWMGVIDASYYTNIYEINENKGSQMGDTKTKQKKKKKNVSANLTAARDEFFDGVCFKAMYPLIR